MSGKGKGRGRGKAREPQPPQASGTGPPGASGSGAPGPSAAAAGPSSSSSYARAGGGSAAARAAPPPAAQSLARGMQTMNLGGAAAPGPSAGRPSPGGGNGRGASGPAGRGAVRGRRFVEGSIPVTRPSTLQTKQGSEGDPVGLLANYFRLTETPDWALLRYRVDIQPEEDLTHRRKNLLRVHKDFLGGYLFDGTVLYTINRITGPQNQVLTLVSHNEDKSQAYTISIRGTGEVQFGDFAYVQVFNVLMRSCISSLDLSLVGRDYYDVKAAVKEERFRLELWPGYKTSIRQHEKGILMCVEITHKVMRMETALDILKDCIQRDRDRYMNDFVKEVIGCIVLTKYNNRTYRIDDVDWQKKPTDTFMYRGEAISLVEYMKRKYQITIADHRQPLLISHARARDLRAGMAETIELIPEVCFLTGLTDQMRTNFPLMKALGVHTKVGPSNRIRKLLQFNERLHQSSQAMEQLKKFGMGLERNLVRIPGRVAQTEKILLGNQKFCTAGSNVDWARDVSKNPLLLTMHLSSWVFVVPSKWRRDAQAFAQTLCRVSSGMNFNVGPPEILEIQRDNAAEYAQALGQIMDHKVPQLIMCAVPNNRGDRYAVIKKKCCVDRAVPTQVIVTKNLNGEPRKTMSIATKVAIQLNCKIGGAPWSVPVPLSNLMVVGFDTCHDTASKSQSFGAMVASLDKAMSRYFSAVTPHTSGEELSNNFGLNIAKALRKYKDVNKALPNSILIYRDGVGEGQLPYVVSTELESIKSRLAIVYGSIPYKMTFVIVTKRINTRLFTESQQNPVPGTIVDDVVTDPEKYDFFLVSQSVREGTVSPTSFNVIHDGMELPCDRLQRLTYKMCHLYFNWAGTVRVPAPCQYAHKLAFLAGQALHREPHPALEDLLYFL